MTQYSIITKYHCTPCFVLFWDNSHSETGRPAEKLNKCKAFCERRDFLIPEIVLIFTKYSKYQNTKSLLIRCIVIESTDTKVKRAVITKSPVNDFSLLRQLCMCTSLWFQLKAICLMSELLHNLWVRSGRAAALLASFLSVTMKPCSLCPYNRG